jgi:carnitine-CoA ligase
MINLPIPLRSPHTAFGAGRSLSWLLEARIRDRPDKPFFIWEPFDEAPIDWTYARFGAEVGKVAAGLSHRGVGHGDPVLIHLDNCPEFLLSWFACARLGAVAVSTNTRSSRDEIQYFVGHSGPKIAITQASLAMDVEAAMNNGGDVIIVGDSRKDRRFESLVADESAPVASVSGLAPLSIQYTSGTTGRPKAVIWTHANALWGGKVNAAHEGLTESDVSLAFAPLFHTNAQSYSVLATLWVGGTFVLQPRFSSSRFWPVSLRNRCTFSSQLYFTLRALAQVESPPRHDYRLWATGMCEHTIARDHFNVPTIGWWGMTETISHPIIGDTSVPNQPQTIGRAAPEYEVAVLNDAGAPVQPGETGELLVRGIPGVSLFAGYLHDPMATAASFDEQGWFKTGDRITVTDDGSMIFADRAKDMLRVGAENVAASEIERVVIAVAGVREVAVVGKPDPMLDEVPVAFVIIKEDESCSVLHARILEACRNKLADFKVPREIRFIKDLPRATLGKVAKEKLRNMVRQI